MTTSNMTTVDRLAEKLKTGPMSDFFTEDDLLDICKKAIEKAFFTTIPGSYNQPTQRAEIVTIADEAMRAKVKQFVDEKFSQIVDDEKFQEKMGALMVASLGAVLMDSLKQSWSRQFFTDINRLGDLIADIIKQKL
jgi:hypothetical protein